MSDARDVATEPSETALAEVLRGLLERQATPETIARVALLAPRFTSCPACGAEPWVNIDCRVCVLISGLPASVSLCARIGVHRDVVEHGAEDVRQETSALLAEAATVIGRQQAELTAARLRIAELEAENAAIRTALGERKPDDTPIPERKETDHADK